MRQTMLKNCPGSTPGRYHSELPGRAAAQPIAISTSERANHEIETGSALRRSFYGSWKQGAVGANKVVVTDYRFGGPGFATPKHVGRGAPRTPQAPNGASA